MRLFHLFLLAILECVWSHEFFPSLTRTHKFLKHRSLEVSQMKHFEVVGIKSHLPHPLHSGGGDEFTLPSLTTHPISTSVKFSAFGHDFEFGLVKSKIFAPTYREHKQTYRNGTLIEDRATVLPPSRDCHYQTAAPQNGSVRAGLSTCRGALEGLVVGQELFGIEPAGFHLTKEDLHTEMQKHAGLSISDLHIIYKLTDYMVNGSCPLGEDHEHTQILPDESKPRSKFALSNFLPSFKVKEDLQATQLYVELLLVNDKLRQTQTNGYTEDNAATIANGANVLYQSVTLTPPVQLVLVAQVTFNDGDPYTVTVGSCSACASTEVSVNELLNDFQNWRSGPNAPTHDNGHLLSGYNFQGNVIGYANVNGMCLVSYSGGIDQSYGFGTSLVTATLSHEMGHNFGMQHDGDGNVCPNSGFIMNSVLAVIPTEFSPCSVNYYETYVNNFQCLTNLPTYKWGDPICGNNFVEVGEQCDCGPPPCFNDPCCDGATCLRVEGAVCTAGQGCCDDNCHPRNDTSYKCRNAFSECDVAEYCDGVNSECPLDWYLGAGTPCTTAHNDTGGCYIGSCLSYFAQCKDDTNSFGGWNPCTVSDQTNNNGDNFCANLWCFNPDENTCVFIQNSDGSTDQMLDGVPCGTGFQCFGGSCVRSDKLQKQFFWKPNPWQPCDSCDEEQNRNLSCFFQDVTLASPPPPYQISSNYCSPFSYPSLQQTCDNVTLGCIGSDLFAGSTINFFGVFEIQKLALVLVVFGIVAGTIIIIAGCYKAVTYESGPPPNPRVRQIGKKGQPQRRGGGGAKVRPQPQRQAQQSRARPPSRQGP